MRSLRIRIFRKHTRKMGLFKDVYTYLEQQTCLTCETGTNWNPMKPQGATCTAFDMWGNPAAQKPPDTSDSISLRSVYPTQAECGAERVRAGRGVSLQSGFIWDCSFEEERGPVSGRRRGSWCSRTLSSECPGSVILSIMKFCSFINKLRSRSSQLLQAIATRPPQRNPTRSQLNNTNLSESRKKMLHNSPHVKSFRLENIENERFLQIKHSTKSICLFKYFRGCYICMTF